MPQSGVAVSGGERSQREERRAARDLARAALLEWDAREDWTAREERLPSAVRALDDWSRPGPEPEPHPATVPVDRAALSAHDAPVAAAWSPSRGIEGRRTVTIRGQGAERYVPARSSSRRRPERRYERAGFRPDRAAMWAFVLGLMLILVAVTSAHAATLHAVAHLH